MDGDSRGIVYIYILNVTKNHYKKRINNEVPDITTTVNSTVNPCYISRVDKVQ